MGVKTAAFRSTLQHLSRWKITRTAHAEVIKSQLLCQLSYAPTVGIWLEGQTKIIASLPDFPLTQDERIRPLLIRDH
jgi:hypothetical protein